MEVCQKENKVEATWERQERSMDVREGEWGCFVHDGISVDIIGQISGFSAAPSGLESNCLSSVLHGSPFSLGNVFHA